MKRNEEHDHHFQIDPSTDWLFRVCLGNPKVGIRVDDVVGRKVLMDLLPKELQIAVVPFHVDELFDKTLLTVGFHVEYELGMKDAVTKTFVLIVVSDSMHLVIQIRHVPATR